MRSETGLTVTEMLVALTLLSLFLLLSFPSLHLLVRQHRVQQEEERSVRQLDFGIEVVRLALLDSVSHLSIPTIFTSDDPQVARILASRGLMTGSQALGVMVLDPVPLTAIGSAEAMACGVRPEKGSKAVALALDARAGAVVESVHSAPDDIWCGNRAASRVTLSPTESPVLLRLADQAAVLPHALTYLLVREEYLLYLDNQGMLRRLSVSSGEHQTIATGISAFSLSLEKGASLKIAARLESHNPVLNRRFERAWTAFLPNPERYSQLDVIL